MLEMLWWVSYLCSDEPDIIETHSPQSWASFNMLGEFDFSDKKLQDTIGVLPPKNRSISSSKIGRRKIDDIYAVSIGYRKSYGRFGTVEQLGPRWRGVCSRMMSCDVSTQRMMSLHSITLDNTS